MAISHRDVCKDGLRTGNYAQKASVQVNTGL